MSSPEAIAALKLTLIVSAIVVVLNALFGTLIAWVLVRDEFRGKRVVNALIDLPFALPTIVAGVVLLALYGKGGPAGIDITFTRAAVGLALLFVTLPFVVRSVQPVLIELDRSMEEAASSLGAGSWTVFRRIVLPNLTPAILSGAALSFARALGEFGSVVLDLRKPPLQDGGGVGVHLQPGRERQRERRRLCLCGAAGIRAGGTRGDDLAVASGGPPCPIAPLRNHGGTMSASESATIGRPAAPAARLTRPPRAREQGREGDGAATARRLGLRFVALGYLLALLGAPVAMIFYRTFEHGLAPVWDAVTQPNAMHAFWLSVELVAIVVPLNTVFGIGIALLIERGRFRGKALLGLLLDLPFAISPVVVGLALVLVYGRTGWFGDWLTTHGIQVIFSIPGMVLATAFVSLPFVARETVPVLHELGTDAEQAASTLGASAWQTFRKVTLPAIRWGVVYGVVLTTARALGEFGAVSIVSGRLEGQTQTLPLYVQDRFENFDATGAYAAAVVLALLAFATLLTMNLLAKRTHRDTVV